MSVKGGHFMASTNSFNKHLLDVCAEVYREFRWKRQGPDMQELKCWQTHLPPPATCGSCAELSLSIWKEEVKKDVGCRGHNVALESGSSQFKSRLSQLRVPKPFTQESFGLSFLHSWLFGGLAVLIYISHLWSTRSR